MKRFDAASVFVFFLVLYGLTMGGHLYSPDEELLFLTTQSLAERGSLAIEPHESLGDFATRPGRDGDLYAQYGVGQPLLAIPFYLFGRALAGAMGERSYDFSVIQYYDRNPRGHWERFGVSLFNQVVAALLVTLLFSFTADLTGDRRAAALTAVLYGAGTIAWVHSKPFFTETLATLCIFSSFALLVRARIYNRPGWITLAGVAAGYGLLVRMDSLFAFAALGLLVIWPDSPPPELQAGSENGRNPFVRATTLIRSVVYDRATWLRIARFAPPVALACLTILAINYACYGDWKPGYVDQPEGVQFINPLLVGLYGFLMSVGKGLFFFSPPLVLFFSAIRRFTKESPMAGWGVIAMVLSLLLIHAKWVNWPGGWCWGPRHIFMVHIFLALPISVLLAGSIRPATWIAYTVLLVVGIGVQLYGASQNFIDYYQIAFRDPFTPPTATVRYTNEDLHLGFYYDLQFVDPELRPSAPPVSGPMAKEIRELIEFQHLLAPIGDSIWRIRNSQWALYGRMWKAGFHDFFWLEAAGKHSPVEIPRRRLEALLQPSMTRKPDIPAPPRPE